LDPNNWAAVSPEMADLLANHDKLKKTTNEAKKALDEIKSRLLFLMGDKKYAKTDTSKITIVSKKSNSFNSKKFKEDHPDLFNQYSKQIESRYPLIKSIK
jgi:predicted phage-related endonuclease